MMNQRTVVTVDGLAASGKTALAKGLAKRLNFEHLNSGLFYRATALLAIEQGIELGSEREVAVVVRHHRFNLVKDAHGEAHLLIDGISRTDDLSASAVSEGASLVARHPEVRELLLAAQKNAFPGAGLVAEGRDMGTVIFPSAPVKFFVEARLEVRAQRRAQQLMQRGEVVDTAALQRELANRDARDAGRDVAPLVAAEGSIVIDNSDHPLEVIIERMYQAVRCKVPA